MIPQIKRTGTESSKRPQSSEVSKLIFSDTRRPAKQTLRQRSRHIPDTNNRALPPSVLASAGTLAAMDTADWKTRLRSNAGVGDIPTSQDSQSMAIKRTNPLMHHFNAWGKIRPDGCIAPTRPSMRRPTTGAPRLPQEVSSSARIPIESMAWRVERQATKQRGTTPEPSGNLSEVDRSQKLPETSNKAKRPRPVQRKRSFPPRFGRAHLSQPRWGLLS